VFLITSCVYLLGGICANMFIKSNVQEWANQSIQYQVLEDD
jgi:hypothetical protein